MTIDISLSCQGRCIANTHVVNPHDLVITGFAVLGVSRDDELVSGFNSDLQRPILTRYAKYRQEKNPHRRCSSLTLCESLGLSMRE